MCIARPSCFMLLLHDIRRADSRALWTAGRSKPISVAMIAITTNSSTKVNPRRRSLGCDRLAVAAVGERFQPVGERGMAVKFVWLADRRPPGQRPS